MIKAFLISNLASTVGREFAFSHLKKIGDRYNQDIKLFTIHGFKIGIVGSSSVNFTDEFISFTLCVNESRVHSDRFLKVEINRDGLFFENDYAGSIPVYFSNRAGFSASNIEPCVYAATGSSVDDLSAENLYGYLKYGHFIWDETAWKHIYQLLPDSSYAFDSSGLLKQRSNNRTVFSSEDRCTLADKNVADDLFELNQRLVKDSLKDYDEIILPLSSGYDSRMIFAVLSGDRNLRKKMKCFTYGCEGSVEVEAARRLAATRNVNWSFVDLPCQYLGVPELSEVSDIFGASLHMHGMYQFEFFREIQKKISISSRSAITSGFMTGVPAGQHNGLLKVSGSSFSLTEMMGRFSQSRVWAAGELEQLPIFEGKNYEDVAEARFRQAFDRFDGHVFQKIVMLDVWTRQRQFIGYYPRTFEWLIPAISPHMTPEYANFFMSLSKKHLWNRKAVELMFARHYKDLAKVISNSNGTRAIANPLEGPKFQVSRILSRFGLGRLVPKSLKYDSFEFNLKSVNLVGEDAFYPAFDSVWTSNNLNDWAGGNEMSRQLFNEAIAGNIDSYSKYIRLQSVFLNLQLDGR